MTYPEFYNKIETIKVQDELSSFLGAFEDGIYEISYLDIVKGAGHSCPTVLGAYLMTSEALKALYPNTNAKRGEIEVSFKERQSEAVAGVIGNVVMNITGACTNNGFKGIGGNFDRNYLLKFEQDINEASARFTRVDTKKSVDVIYNPSSIQFDPSMQALMQKCVQGSASADEKVSFGKLWQKRVEEISKNISSVITVKEV
ncbi:MAG: FmdE family protein [Poseidonibacter sp.]